MNTGMRYSQPAVPGIKLITHPAGSLITMCRFVVYQGPPVLLHTLLIEPGHSLIRQSIRSLEREEPLNGDGFGVGWYADEYTDEPAVFRSVTPAWNNRNLRNLARVVASSSVYAHVRAATQSSHVNEANCHPFRFGRYMFMHNGDVGNFRRIRRHLLGTVSDRAFGNVFGSTDSEHFFAVVIDELLKRQADTAMDLAVALDTSIKRVEKLVEEYGEGMPSYFNIALGDGRNAVVSRYTNDPDHPPESLYCYSGNIYKPCIAGHDRDEAVIVSSERLTEDPDWQIVPANHMVVISGGRMDSIIPCGLTS